MPGTREIKGAVLDRSCNTIQHSDRPLHFPPHCIDFFFDPPSNSFCSCRLDRRELAGLGAVLITLPVNGLSTICLFGDDEMLRDQHLVYI